MAAEQEVTIIIKAKDMTSEEMIKIKKRIEGAAKETGKKAGGMVTEQTGKALSQLNEKTEKGRQLLTTFGGAMGGVAGQAVYYGGTLCLDKATEVATMAGHKKIKDININDTVLAYDSKAKVFHPAKVTAVIDCGMKDVISLYDKAGTRVVTCTMDHRWQTPDGLMTLKEMEGDPITITTSTGDVELFIDPVTARREHCFDISIDTPDHLYMLASGLVTHNSYVVGRFKTWELGLMAVVAALAMVGSALYSHSQIKLKKSAEATAKYKKETDKLVKSAQDLYKAQKDLYEGIDRKGAMQRDLEFNKFWLENRLENVKALKEAEMQSIGDVAWNQDALRKKVDSRWNKQIRTIEANLKATARSAAKVLDAIGLEKKTKDRDAAAKQYWQLSAWEQIGHDVQAVARDTWDRLGKDAEKFSAKYWSDREKFYDGLAPAVNKALEKEHRVKAYWEDRMAAYSLQKYEQAARDKSDAQAAVISNSVEMFANLGSLMAQSEEQHNAVRIAAIIAHASIKIYDEMAAGFAALGNFNPWGAAMHFTSAGLYGTLAATNIATGGGGAGGGAVTGSAAMAGLPGPGSAERSTEPEKREYKFVINLGGREAGRAIFEALESHKDNTNPGRRDGKMS